MKNFYEIRHLQKKCFLGIYISVAIFLVPGTVFFSELEIFKRPSWSFPIIPGPDFWGSIEKCPKFLFSEEYLLWHVTAKSYSVFTVKFPVFRDFTGNDWC